MASIIKAACLDQPAHRWIFRRLSVAGEMVPLGLADDLCHHKAQHRPKDSGYQGDQSGQIDSSAPVRYALTVVVKEDAVH